MYGSEWEGMEATPFSTPNGLPGYSRGFLGGD